MWTTRTHSQRSTNSNNRTTRHNIPVVWRSTRIWQLLVAQHEPSRTTTCIASTMHSSNTQHTNSPENFWSTLQWTNHYCTCTRRQCRTCNQLHWHYGQHWCSNTCLPTMVCTRVPNTDTYSKQGTTIAHSHGWWDQALWIQMGLHAQCWRTTSRHTILRVWRTTAHCIRIKAWTRLWTLNSRSKKNNQQWSMQRASTQHWSRSTVCTTSGQQWYQYHPITHYRYNGQVREQWQWLHQPQLQHKVQNPLSEETVTSGRTTTRDTW